MKRRFHPNGIITLLTDFGEQDYYVPAMKGVMLTVCPDLRIVDAGHQVPPQKVATASYLLANYALEYPPGTVHVVVVDPGVGSNRSVLVARLGSQLVVGPDNGFVSRLVRQLPAEGAEAIDCRRAEVEGLGIRAASATFHGRDVFAPLAARLASGRLEPEDVGPRFEPILLHEPRLSARRKTIQGEVIHVDRFGNLVTSIAGSLGPGTSLPLRLDVGGMPVERFVRTYSDAEEGALVFLVGSGGELEVSLVGGSAARRLGATVGTAVACRMA